jgi:hypothetical protein
MSHRTDTPSTKGPAVLSRRALLAVAVPSLLLSPFDGAGAGAEEEVTSLVIGKFLAQNAAGGIISSLAASVVGPKLFGPSEEITKLNEIIDRLRVLQDSLDTFRSDVEKRFNRQEYLTTANNVLEINRTNRFLMGPYQKWVAGDQNARSEFFDRLAQSSVGLNRGLQDWNDAAVGTEGAGDALFLPGMIKTWHKTVIDRHNGLLGPAAAREIQDYWDRLDASQALTVYFSVIDKAVKGNAESIRYRLREWRDFRTAQLKLLRGVVRKTDLFYDIDNPGQPLSTPLNFLPENVAITTRNSIMWSLDVKGPIQKCDKWQDFDRLIRGLRPGYDWGLRNTDDMRELFRECGGAVDPDYFLTGMRNAGFNFHDEKRPGDWGPNNMSLWTANTSHNREVTYQGKSGTKRELRYRRDIVIEGSSPRGADADWQGKCLFGRNVGAEEASKYWFRG